MIKVNGNQLLRICQQNEFNDGDVIIAVTKDDLGNEDRSIYTYENEKNGSFSIYDVECDKYELDVYDLSECEFIVIRFKTGVEK